MVATMSKAQTAATERYRAKKGIISKNFKITKELSEAYAKACEKAGVSQTGQIIKMMEEFIKTVEKT